MKTLTLLSFILLLMALFTGFTSCATVAKLPDDFNNPDTYLIMIWRNGNTYCYGEPVNSVAHPIPCTLKR